MSKSDSTYAHMANKPYEEPCLLCGATARNSKGQDPCIPDLPGVLHACCGHGRRQAYVMLENCVTFYGEIQFPRPITLELNAKYLVPETTNAPST